MNKKESLFLAIYLSGWLFTFGHQWHRFPTREREFVVPLISFIWPLYWAGKTSIEIFRPTENKLEKA